MGRDVLGEKFGPNLPPDRQLFNVLSRMFGFSGFCRKIEFNNRFNALVFCGPRPLVLDGKNDKVELLAVKASVPKSAEDAIAYQIAVGEV